MLLAFPVHAGEENVVELDSTSAETKETLADCTVTIAESKQEQQKTSRKPRWTIKIAFYLALVGTAVGSMATDFANLQARSDMIETGPIHAYSDNEIKTFLYPLVNYEQGCMPERPKSIEEISPYTANKKACVCPKNETCKCIIVNCDKDGKFKKAVSTLYVMSTYSLMSSVAVIFLASTACIVG